MSALLLPPLKELRVGFCFCYIANISINKCELLTDNCARPNRADGQTYFIDPLGEFNIQPLISNSNNNNNNDNKL